MNLLSEGTKISSAVTPTAGVAASTDLDGSILDMAGFDGVLVLVRMGAITATAVTGIRMEQGDASDLSDGSDLEGTAQAIADDDDDKTFFIDLFKPTKRYVRLVVDRATADAVVSSAHYFQYTQGSLSKGVPTTHGSNVAGESHVTPDEGTA